MRKTIFPVMGLSLLAAGAAIGWFAALRKIPDSAQETTRRGPALAHSTEAEESLKMAGFDRGFVYRWQGGLLDGHVLLDTPQGVERVSLNTEKMAQDAHQSLAQEAGERDGKAQLDPAQVSGLIVIAIRPTTAGTAGHECIWSISVRIERGGISAGAGSGPHSGRLPDYDGLSRSSRGVKLKLADGGKRDLFELRLRGDLPPAKESRNEAKLGS